MNALPEISPAAAESLNGRLNSVHERIRHACAAAGRAVDDVELLAVSKRHPPAAIVAAYRLGQRAFGENYVSEALEKIARLKAMQIDWHYIGPIQSNKTADIAAHFSWAHSIDREKVAQRLNDQRPSDMPPLNVCLQVNISGETSKSGCNPDALPQLCAMVRELPRLRLRGLMAIPAVSTELVEQRAAFARVRREFESLNALADASRPALDTLSMGMTNDLEAAILEGASIVRIGTAIFGPRAR